MGSPAPKSPSSLVKVSRWSLLGMGFFYGKFRYEMLKEKEDKLREIEEAERPAREAAMKAERERRNQEEMEYLAQQAGVTNKGGSGANASRDAMIGLVARPIPAGGYKEPCTSKKDECKCRFRSDSPCDCNKCR